MTHTRLVCFCGEEYVARDADIKRGWGKTCSKRCAAIKREFGRPNARHLSGAVVKWGRKYKRPNPPSDSSASDRADDMNFFDDPSWDSHKHSLGG